MKINYYILLTFLFFLLGCYKEEEEEIYVFTPITKTFTYSADEIWEDTIFYTLQENLVETSHFIFYSDRDKYKSIVSGKSHIKVIEQNSDFLVYQTMPYSDTVSSLHDVRLMLYAKGKVHQTLDLALIKTKGINNNTNNPIDTTNNNVDTTTTITEIEKYDIKFKKDLYEFTPEKIDTAYIEYSYSPSTLKNVSISYSSSNTFYLSILKQTDEYVVYQPSKYVASTPPYIIAEITQNGSEKKSVKMNTTYRSIDIKTGTIIYTVDGKYIDALEVSTNQSTRLKDQNNVEKPMVSDDGKYLYYVVGDYVYADNTNNLKQEFSKYMGGSKNDIRIVKNTSNMTYHYNSSNIIYTINGSGGYKSNTTYTDPMYGLCGMYYSGLTAYVYISKGSSYQKIKSRSALLGATIYTEYTAPFGSDLLDVDITGNTLGKIACILQYFNVYYIYDIANQNKTTLYSTLYPIDNLRFSPEGDKLVFSEYKNGQYDVMLLDIATKKITNLTNTPNIDERYPYWH